MKLRQTVPRQWLIIDARADGPAHAAIERLPRGSGVLLLHHRLSRGERARLMRALRRTARRRGLLLLDAKPDAVARVHDTREIARARLAGARLLLLSPLFETASHPEWKPLPRMRAAALARLAGRPLVALGGMDARRFAQVQPLGFDGWAGIDAWLGIRT